MEYAARAGIEGTLSQGVRAFDLCQARYHGLAKTHVPHVATAAALNLARLSPPGSRAYLVLKPDVPAELSS